MSDSNEGSGHQGRKSSSRRSHKDESSDHPQPVILSQTKQDERIKRKMAEAENIADRALLVVPNHPQKKKTIETVNRDEKLKRKMAQADQIASSLFLDESHSWNTLDEDPNNTSSSALYLAATRAPPVAGIADEEIGSPALPLEPSRRVLKQRDSDVIAPGAYAIAGFNESSSSQDLVPDEELTDYLVFDEHEDQSINDMNDLMPAHEDFEDEMIQGSGSGRMSRRSGALSSGRYSGGSGRVSSSGGGGSERSSSVHFSSDEERNGNKDCGQEVFEADVVLAINVDEAEDRKKVSRRRIMVGTLAVVSLILSVAVALYLFFTRDSPDDDLPRYDDDHSSTTKTPTLSPTVSPAPTFTTVPVTVLISFDGNAFETGWELECDGAMIDSVPADSYADKKGGDVISETLQVKENADCKFTIYDLLGDGLCCESGRGFYQLYLAGEDDLANGFLAEGGAFKDSETVEFVAVASGNSL